jgi:hypothetical protein
MGYTHDAGFCAFIPPTAAFGDTASWSLGAGQTSNSVVLKCDATDETANLFIPIIGVPSHRPDANGNAVKGGMITKIEIDYEIVAAACDTVTPVIYKNKRGADGADVTVSTVAFTYDAGHDTDDERDDLDEHRMELTIDTPFYLEDDEYLWVAIAFDKAATSTVEFLGAFAYYTLKA